MSPKNSVQDIVSPPAKPWDIDCSVEPSMTKQEFKNDCDVNVIISRCLKSGMPLPSSVVAPIYADVTQFGDYRDCLNRVLAAQESFNALPADLRSYFSNDPSQLLAFIADPANKDKAVELGLLEKPVLPPAPPAPPVPPGT